MRTGLAHPSIECRLLYYERSRDDLFDSKDPVAAWLDAWPTIDLVASDTLIAVSMLDQDEDSVWPSVLDLQAVQREFDLLPWQTHM